jgi:hypothetical protein
MSRILSLPACNHSYLVTPKIIELLLSLAVIRAIFAGERETRSNMLTAHELRRNPAGF